MQDNTIKLHDGIILAFPGMGNRMGYPCCSFTVPLDPEYLIGSKTYPGSKSPGAV